MRYIFEIKIKPGHTVDEYVAAWKRGSGIIQKMPGARGTRLYFKIGEPRTLLAVAEWKSKKYRDKAMSELDKAGEKIQMLIHKHKEFGKIRRIGEYDETKWAVLPLNLG